MHNAINALRENLLFISPSPPPDVENSITVLCAICLQNVRFRLHLHRENQIFMKSFLIESTKFLN